MHKYVLYSSVVINSMGPTTDVTCEDRTVHLIGGGDISRGRVQYCHEGSWYSVCASDIGLEEARAICTTLGYYRGPFGKTIHGEHLSVLFNIV